ncbi:hypothetical protein BKA63DRAFT_112731 [Paraphoma chrysanthemicola]|nr:hypothetical protein BKA63DRAFT_112731 [Paraphoma chrysanthemicola]
MKRAFLIILALWACTTIAAVTFYDRRDIELPPGAHMEGNVLVLHNDPAEYSDDEDDVVHTEGYSPQAEDLELANTTSTTLTKRWGKDQNPVLVYAGGPKQHVCTLRKNRLRNKIIDCLRIVGITGHPDDNSGDKGRWKEWCSENYEAYCASSCRIPNIVYNTKPKDTYATNSRLDISVQWSELYESAYPGIREAAFSFAADIYTQMTEDAANCYEVNFKGSRHTTMCNTVTNVLVVLPYAKDHPLAARLNVVLRFNGKTLEGELDCEKGLKKARESYSTTYQPQLAKVMNWSKVKMPLISACNKEDCFSVRKGGYLKHNDLANKPIEPILGHFDWKGNGCDWFHPLE